MRRKNRYTEKRKRVTPYGQWQYPGEVTTIPDNRITMQGVPYPVLGVSDVGDMKMMMPGMDYVFNGSEVTEYPVMQTGGIHIKKENRGKFTEAAKRAGKSVQAYAAQILANKGNYSPTMVKRANFARNASKFKHQEGGTYLDTFFSNADKQKNMYDRNAMTQLDNYFTEQGLTENQKKALLYNILIESGGAKTLGAHGNGYYGLVGWDSNRYGKIKDKSLIGQAAYLVESLKNDNGKYSWNHGGDGSGYNSWIDARNAFWNPDADYNSVNNALIYGYIRPKDKVGRKNNGMKYFQTGGVPFEEWYKTVPAEKNDTTNYDLRTAYQYLPYSDMVKFANDKDFHLGSVAEMPDGNYRFLKSKDHPTIQKELDWYYGNTPEAKEFRNNYTLDKSSHYYKYVKKKQIGKYLEGNYVQPQSVDSVLQSWNDMMAKATGDADEKARLAGTILGLASTISGAAASQWGAENGKQNWMKGITTPRQAKKYLTSEQFGKDLAASTADYEDTTEYAELPQEVVEFQNLLDGTEKWKTSHLPGPNTNRPSKTTIFAKNVIDNPLTVFANSKLKWNPYKFATGGNTATLAELENGEIVSGEEPLMFNGLNHENYGNQNETKKNVVALSNDADREVRENPQLTKMPYHTNPYETIRRIINGEFIFPSTVGLSGILEPRNGDDYWLARWLNGLKGKRQAGGGISKHQTNPFLNPPQVNIPDGMTPEEYFSTLKPSTTRVIDGKVQTIMPWDLDKYETPQDKQIRLNYEIGKKKDIEANTQQAIQQAKPKSEDSFYGAYTTNVATPTRSYLDSNLTTNEKNFIADEEVRKARQTAAEESKYIQNIGNETAKLVGSFIPGLNVPILASWFADAANEFKENPNIETASLGLLAGLPFFGRAGKAISEATKWDIPYMKAIKVGNMAEAQRLRDLHFKVSALDTKVDIPLWTSSEEPFNSFDLSHFGETDTGFFGYGHYLTPIEKYAATYHPVNRKFYVNVKNPYIGSNDQHFNRVQYVKDRLARRKEHVLHNLRDGKLTRFSKKLGINESTSLEDAEHLVDKYIADATVKWNDKYVKYVDEFEGKDGVLSWRDLQGIPNKREGIYKEVVVPRGEQIKSADAVTYDDAGNIIPLSKRDNFNINDIRYLWPLLFAPTTIPFMKERKQKTTR